MKKIFFIIFCFVQSFTFSQTRDLFSLTKGDYLGFNALYDSKKNLYGYISLNDLGKTSEKKKKFEYVILDKNLNPFTNEKFETEIPLENYTSSIDNKGRIVLSVPTETRIEDFFIKTHEFFHPFSIVIDPKNNTVEEKWLYTYENNSLKKIDEFPNNSKVSKEKMLSTVFELVEGGFIIHEYKVLGNAFRKSFRDDSLIKLNQSKKEIWRYNYNSSKETDIYENITLVNDDKDYLYCLYTKTQNSENSNYLLVLDSKTGQEVSKKPILNLSNAIIKTFNYYQTSWFFGNKVGNNVDLGDKVVLIGKDFQKDFSSEGFVVFMIGKENFEHSYKTIKYEDLKRFLPEISKKGNIGDYSLEVREFLFLKDGGLGILMEKYNEKHCENLIYAYTDSNYKVKGVNVFQKEKSKISNNYLYSQFRNDGKTVDFFYRDKTKGKNWNLYINSVVDGKSSLEILPISLDKNFITPFMAKEGFTLLWEYNKNEKINTIRLEKLNN